jgi:dipeptidase D
MNRLLFAVAHSAKVQVAEIHGGGLRNAIPRESFAKIVVPANHEAIFIKTFNETVSEVLAEYGYTERDLNIKATSAACPELVMELEAQKALLHAIYGAPNGVYSMSATMPDLVETSNNIASVLVKNGSIEVKCLTRSSIESAKYDLAHALQSVFNLAHFEVSFTGSYPGWAPNVNSEILKVLVSVYESLNNQKPRVVACHAGLECGILGKNYPGIDMISFGPTIHGAHSPDERASISSAKKYWNFVLAILQNIPVKS